MLTKKLPAAIVAYLKENNRLFDPISTGLTILQFKVNGRVEFIEVKPIDIQSRGDEGAVVIVMGVEDKQIEMIDSMFLQSLVVTEEHFALMNDKVKHKHTFSVKGGKNEEFESLFFFEDVDDAGLRDADAMQPIHKALKLGDNANDTDLGQLNMELVGIMVNKRRDDDAQLIDHTFPRSRAGAYPQYRALREKFEENNGSGEIYTIGQYIEDFEQLNGKKPNIASVVNVPRNWTFTPIFVDKGGVLK